MSQPNQIIIKRVKKVSGSGHHGGAWKVAYADFVTAMMAFFLLMWLLNATTEDQRKGIADYFNPAIPISQISGGGADALNGATVFSEDTLAKDGTGGSESLTGVSPEGRDAATVKSEAPDDGELEEVREDLLQKALKSEAEGLAKHIQTRITPEGLVIELVEVDGSPLFEIGSSKPSPTMVRLLEVVASTISLVTNKIAIVGHTDSLAYAASQDYTNWELSSDRANTARRLMVNAGLNITQVDEVSGKADTQPLTKDSLAPQNRRISITLLKT